VIGVSPRSLVKLNVASLINEVAKKKLGWSCFLFGRRVPTKSKQQKVSTKLLRFMPPDLLLSFCFCMTKFGAQCPWRGDWRNPTHFKMRRYNFLFVGWVETKKSTKQIFARMDTNKKVKLHHVPWRKPHITHALVDTVLNPMWKPYSIVKME
jgi:hypothetical protein